MRFSRKTLCILSILALVSCGQSVNYLVEGNRYNSPIFAENFYRHWDSELKNVNDSHIVNHALADDEFITSFNELYKYDENVLISGYSSADDYGEDYKMNNVNEMFNYGYQSKLFDGQVQCLGYYQLARVQTDPNGFSMRFSKESDKLDYFAMQFKATTDNTADCYKVGSEEKAKNDSEMFHNSTVHLNVSLYTKNDANEIVRNSFNSTIEFDNKSTNNGSRYVFYAFSLKEYNLERLTGLSISYTMEDELVDWNKTKGIDVDYSLMIYEMFMPYTNWH